MTGCAATQACGNWRLGHHLPKGKSRLMRICIFGSGAVGSHFAVRLALAGHDVSCVMRGAHLQAMQARGLTLKVGDAEFTAKVRASDDPAALGAQDLVISTLKATGVNSLATGLMPLLGKDTAVVFAQNGIPWWYDIGLPADHPPPPDLAFLDPGGRLRAAIPKARIMGGVIFSSNEVVAPGIAANLSLDRNRLVVGECDDRASERIERLRAALKAASSGSPAPGPRPNTSPRSCRTTSLAAPWRSTCWCGRRRRSRGRRACPRPRS